jgi:hypothetical protein
MKMQKTFKKLIFIGYFFLFLSLISFGQVQQWQWAQSGNGNSAESAVSVVADTSGNAYVAGNFSSDSIFFGDTLLVSHGNDDIFLVRYDTYGNVVWAKCFGSAEYDNAACLATDGSGNIYMTGYFGDTIFFGSKILISKGFNDVFVVKLSPDGNVSWAKQYGGSDYDWGQGIDCDDNGNIYITGLFDSDTINLGSNTFYNAGDDDIFVAKLDNSGNIIWAESEGGSQADVGTRIKTNSNGKVFLTGYFRSSFIVLGSDTLYNTGESDSFIAMLTASGTFQWGNSFKGSDDDFIRSLSVTDNDEIFLAGSFFSDTLRIGYLSLYNNGDNDIFISRFNALGNPIWSKSTGGTDWDMAAGIAVDTFDNIYICGSFRSSSVAFETNSLTNSGESNIFLVKYGFNGTLKWAKKAGGTYTDAASDVATDAAGNVYLTGDYSSGTIAFGNNTLVNTALADIYLAKMNSEYNAIPENDKNDFAFNVFPNPSSGLINISFLIQDEGTATIDIYNILGEKYTEVICENLFAKENYTSTIDLPTGVYCITLSSKMNKVSKILIVR